MLRVSEGAVPVERGSWLGGVGRGYQDTPLPTLRHPAPHPHPEPGSSRDLSKLRKMEEGPGSQKAAHIHARN